MNKIPTLYENKENCCGCTACYAICPVKAITMTEDDDTLLLIRANVSAVINAYKYVPLKQTK